MAKKKSYTKNQVDEINRRYETMIGNLNAEKYNIVRAKEMFMKAIGYANMKGNVINEKGVKFVDAYLYDFIGEIARELKVTKEFFNLMIKKFPELKYLNDILHNNVESNCFNNTKRGIIKEGIGTVNLKTNYKWTERIDLTADMKADIRSLFPEIPNDNNIKETE